MQINKLFDTAIIGGGVAGTSLLYTLAEYTDMKSIVLFEKYEELALLNSNPKANSQTLHVGDIETNYTYEKAQKVKKNASFVSNYIYNVGGVEDIGFVRDKMVLAVGEDEVAALKERYERFKSLYPYLELWDGDFLREYEPKLMEGRSGPVLAMRAGRLRRSITKSSVTVSPFRRLRVTRTSSCTTMKR